MAAKEKKNIISNEAREFIDPILTGPANKAWRALILLNRETSGMPKAAEPTMAELTSNHHIANTESFSASQMNNPWVANKALNQFDTKKSSEALLARAKDFTTKRPNITIPKNQIIIINTNTVPATKLIIQNRPNELSVDPVSSWASVKSFGRNDPFQIYNGSEKTISFDISWYSVDAENRDDVVTKCKLLESWTKSDGYQTSPPILKISWGGSEIFESELFILTSANYKLTHFQSSHYQVSGNAWPTQNKNMPAWPAKQNQVPMTTVKDLKLLPNCATQTLIFKKVSMGNTTHSQIVNPDILKRTIGVER